MSQLSVFSSRYQLRHHSKIKRHIHFHLIFYSCFYFRNIAYCFNCLYVKYTILFRRNKNVLFVCLNPTGGKNIQIGKFMENPKKKKKEHPSLSQILIHFAFFLTCLVHSPSLSCYSLFLFMTQVWSQRMLRSRCVPMTSTELWTSCSHQCLRRSCTSTNSSSRNSLQSNTTTTTTTTNTTADWSEKTPVHHATLPASNHLCLCAAPDSLQPAGSVQI